MPCWPVYANQRGMRNMPKTIPSTDHPGLSDSEQQYVLYSYDFSKTPGSRVSMIWDWQPASTLLIPTSFGFLRVVVSASPKKSTIRPGRRSKRHSPTD